MEIQNETLRLFTYGVVIFIALIIAIKVFPFTLSVFTVLSTSPLGLVMMLISFVIAVIFYTGVFTAAVIEPKEEPQKYDPRNSASVKKFTDLSAELEKQGLSKISEKIVFIERNEKPVVFETTFKNNSDTPISFGYALHFLLPNDSLYGGTVTEVIELKPNEEYSYTLISPSNISGSVFIEEKIKTKGIFIEIK